MCGKWAGQRSAGIHRLHPCEGQRIRTSVSLVDAEDSPRTYWERLDAYEELAQEELGRKTGKRGRQRTKQVKQRKKQPHRRVSRTGPDAGYLNHPGKPHGMHYLSHQTLGTDHGIILDMAVTPGDAGDQEPYLDQLERVMNIVPVQATTADSIYDYGLFHQVLGDFEIDFYARPMKFQPKKDA